MLIFLICLSTFASSAFAQYFLSILDSIIHIVHPASRETRLLSITTQVVHHHAAQAYSSPELSNMLIMLAGLSLE